MGKNIGKLIYLFILAVLASGCVAMLKPQQRLFSFKSNPEGATVVIDGKPVGVTPVKISSVDYLPFEVVFKKDGYESQGENVGTHNDIFWLIMENIPIPIWGMAFAQQLGVISVSTLDKKEIFYQLKPSK